VSQYSTANYFLEGLCELQLDYLFCNLGTDYAPIIEEMARWDAAGRKYPQPILCPHENVAIHMAGGYAIASGKGQAVMVHVDVGTGNTVNGLHNLSRGRVPVLLIAGRAPYTVRGELPGGRDNYVHFIQEPFDMASVVRPYVKWEYNLPSGLVVKEALRRAHSVIHSDPKGPAYLTLARETLTEHWDASRVCAFSAEKYGPTSASGVDEETISNIADRLLNAENPAMMTGYAGRNHACPAVVQELAELLGIRVFEFSCFHLNLSQTSPCSCGSMSAQALPEVDVGLLVDVDVPWIPRLGSENPRSYWIQIDVDTIKKDIPMWGFPSHLRVQADSHKVLKRLLEVVKQRITPEVRARAAQRLERLVKQRRARDAETASRAVDRGAPGEINPAYLSCEIAKVMGEEDVLVNEAITNASAVCSQIPRTRPGTYIGVALGGSGLGFGGGTALGVKLAKPGSNVFLVCGDGSFYFSNPAAVLSVSRRYNLPIFITVLDNSGWKAVRDATLRVFPDGVAKQTNHFQSALGERPRFEKIAEAFDAHGECVTDPSEVPRAIERSMDAVKNGRSALLVAQVPRVG